MYVSLQDLGILLVLLVLFIAGIFVIIKLANISKVVTGIHRRINDNEKNIQNTVDNVMNSMKNINEISNSVSMNKELLEFQIPGTIKNLHSLSATLKNTSEKVDHSVDVVNTSMMETVSTVQENAQDILGYVRILSEGLRTFLEMFSSNK